jgi:hypothetical protein
MPPESIGRYKIKRELGRGGMATVFLAYDPSFEREVAVKVLPALFLDDPSLRARFEREAKMIAMLEHPAIVPVYDLGEEAGQPYIVMRYMSGGSLADRLKKGALSLEETCTIISRMAPALDAAHSRDIVHRDIKPGNVLFDQYGNAFLSDFGIARLGEAGGTTLTGESIVGTPAYMSPEQVQADKTIDGRSDIYALGVLVYQMLTGQVPYQADTPARVMLMHILEPVPNILERKAGLPTGCEQLIAHAMAKSPTDRFQTTALLAEGLEALVHPDKAAHPARASDQGQTIFSGHTLVSVPKTPVPTAGQAVRATAPAAPPAPRYRTAPEPAVPYPAAPVPSAAADFRPAKKRSPVLLLALLALVVIGGAAFAVIYLNGQPGRTAQLPGGQASATLPAVVGPTATSLPPTEAPTLAPTTTIPAVLVESSTPTPQPPPPTETPIELSPTPTSEPRGPAIGGADKIGFISGSNVWVANLDGTQLQQLTEDGTAKWNLQWTPGGQALAYIVGKCIQTVRSSDGQVNTLVCFNYVDTFDSFSISPSGEQIAINIDHQLYIVPYQPEALGQVKVRSDLTEIAACKDFAPYTRNMVRSARWSKDGSQLAIDVLGVIDGVRVDIVQVIDLEFCVPNPHINDNFPPPRFTIKGYDKIPVLQNFSWDGIFLFAMNNQVRNDGFGDLYIYNMELHKARLEINPVDNRCCYRDAEWSPDGSHLVFAYQDYLQGSNSVTRLFLIDYGSIGTGAQYEPLPLPDITDPREKPQPVLRPAIGP